MPTTRTHKRKSKPLKKKGNLQLKPRSPLPKPVTIVSDTAVNRKNNKNVGKKRSHIKHQSTSDRAVGVKRLLMPFHKLHKSQPAPAQKTKMTISNEGLTAKERNYIICSCAQQSTQYAKLKALAFEAQKNRKVFRINGKCDPLRDALVERGWVEQIPAARMNLTSIRNKKYENESHLYLALAKLFISNLVQKSVPSFIWDLKEPELLSQKSKVIYNKFTRESPLWTTKQGLCATVRHNHWYFIEDVAEVTSPRTYNSFDEGEKEEFDSDYKLTACTSLLKWLLSMEASEEPVSSEDGTVSLRVIVFALKRCKEYLYKKHNNDIDRPCSDVTNVQWNAFLKKYYILIEKQGKFKPDKENKILSYLNYAKYVVRAIYKYRPQLSCEGCHNIWIIKPANCSRGRGIRLASKLAVLTDLLNRGKYVFQKYIEESMLIYDTKFDVRQYYLVTNLMPLEIWMYQDCYLKFSSQKYNLKNFHEAIHLTNNAVQRKYKNCNNRHPELPQHNMWSLATFKEYLEKIDREDVWEKTIYPGMKKSIIGIMLSCQDSSVRWKNRFELYGCDFILDKNCKPWLIEINAGPDLNPTTNVTAEICPNVLSDLVRVVIDRAKNPSAYTGKFECIYRQNIYGRPCVATDKLIIQGSALPSNYFSRGHTEEPTKKYATNKFNRKTRSPIPRNKKSQTIRKRTSKNAMENSIGSHVKTKKYNENKSTFSLHSFASSNNLRQCSDNMKTDVQNPIQYQFAFSKLDDDDVSRQITDDEITNYSEPNKKIDKKNVFKRCYPQIVSQETGAKSKNTVMDLKFVDFCETELSGCETEPSSCETVKAVALPIRCTVKENHVNDKADIADVSKPLDKAFDEASKQIFSFLDKKRNEYVKDIFPQK